MIHDDREEIILASGQRARKLQKGKTIKETVYRYRPINPWLERILVYDELFFPTAAACNDPFDCRFNATFDGKLQGLEKHLREEREWARMADKAGMVWEDLYTKQLVPHIPLAAMTDAELEDYADKFYTEFGFGDPDKMALVKDTVENARNRIGVCCFAARGDNVLMYAHYADQHRGICLEFLIRNGGQRYSIFEEGGLGFDDVVYQDEPSAVQLYEVGTQESLRKITLTKHSRWMYEEEIRVIRMKGSGPVRYERAALTGLIFGCNASNDDVALVLKWLGPRSDVSLLKAVPANNARFRLEHLR